MSSTRKTLLFFAAATIATMDSLTQVSAKVTPLNNLNPYECGTTLVSGNDPFPTVVIGFTGCPYYEEFLPTFAKACAQLSNRDCYSFNYTSEEKPEDLDCALNSRAAQNCLGYLPFVSPTLSQYFVASAELPLGTQLLGPLNLGGGLDAKASVDDVKKFINTLPGNSNNSLFKKRSRNKNKNDITDEQMADSVFGRRRSH